MVENIEHSFSIEKKRCFTLCCIPLGKRHNICFGFWKQQHAVVWSAVLTIYCVTFIRNLNKLIGKPILFFFFFLRPGAKEGSAIVTVTVMDCLTKERKRKRERSAILSLWHYKFNVVLSAKIL